MYVIGDAANPLGNSTGRADDSAEVCVQVRAPCGLDDRLVILRSENDVIMQAQMG
jgi:hypothetical protein